VIVVFAVLLAATGLMRLAELVVSVRRMRRQPADVVAEPGLFPAMALLHLGLVTLPLAEVLLLDRPFRPAVGGPALAALALATALRVWTLRAIGGAWNVRVVRPGAVATTGPYRWIRHPNYLVVVIEIAALPLVHSAWLAALWLSVANALVLGRRIRTEEAALATVPEWVAAMGPKYRFIPGIF
jgi:methyltransferase